MGEELRRILEENEGRFVSGEEIGRRLGTSRAAVWKQVQALRRRGYGIEGARGSGYRLLGRPDAIDREDVFGRLEDRGFWADLVVHPVIDSTNSRAMRVAEAGARHGTVVVADAQTSGRGRFGRRWESPPGVNIYLSLLLRPPIEPPRAPQLTLVTAVALAEAVEKGTGLAPRLKWPNDLYIGGRKAAGILAEMAADPDLVRHVVIGVGLNVNAQPGDFPEELRETATSLRIAAGRTFPRAGMLALFLDAFAAAYGRFLAGGLAPFLPAWRRRSLLDGKRAALRLRDEDVRGTVLGIDDTGRLLFRREGARETERFAGGEIVDFER